jgi:hypothetical protein
MARIAALIENPHDIRHEPIARLASGLFENDG